MFLFALNNYPVRCYFEIVWLFYFLAVLHTLVATHSSCPSQSLCCCLSGTSVCQPFSLSGMLLKETFPTLVTACRSLTVR